MSCKLLPTPPPLPPITGGVSLPAFSIPAFTGDVTLCCHFNLFSFPGFNIPGIPILSAALTAINAGIVTLDQYLAALDLLNVDCPLE